MPSEHHKPLKVRNFYSLKNLFTRKNDREKSEKPWRWESEN
jgi:hypothetical protein